MRPGTHYPPGAPHCIMERSGRNLSGSASEIEDLLSRGVIDFSPEDFLRTRPGLHDTFKVLIETKSWGDDLNSAICCLWSAINCFFFFYFSIILDLEVLTFLLFWDLTLRSEKFLYVVTSYGKIINPLISSWFFIVLGFDAPLHLKTNLHAAIFRADLSATTNQGANRRVEWRSDARATPIWQVGRFRKVCDCFTDGCVGDYRFWRVGPDFKNENETRKRIGAKQIISAVFKPKTN